MKEFFVALFSFSLHTLSPLLLSLSFSSPGAFLFLTLSLSHSVSVSSYSLDGIHQDSLQIDPYTLLSYRGPILKTIWMENNSTSTSTSTREEEKNLCRLLFQETLKPNETPWPPPKTVSKEMREKYLMGDQAEWIDWYLHERQNGGAGYHWGVNALNRWITPTSHCGLYAETHCSDIMKKHKKYIKKKKGMVLGSQNPWAEALLFQLKAKKFITIEYMTIQTDIPNHSYLHPITLSHLYLNNSWSPLAFAFSFSSLEHDGLGRYGDPLNPFADLESIARIRCLLKPGGVLFLGVPFAPDAVVWNAHRLYGRLRTRLLLLGWNVLSVEPYDCDVMTKKAKGQHDCQPILLLQKPLDEDDEMKKKEKKKNRLKSSSEF